MNISDEIDRYIIDVGKGNIRDALNVAIARLKNIAQLEIENARLSHENKELTDSLYKEAKRTVEAHTLIQRLLYAKGTDTLERLDIKPYLEWVEDFPKPPTICKHGNKPDSCAHCHPRWD